MLNRIKKSFNFVSQRIQKSILIKYLFVTVSIILVSFLILGTVLIVFVSDRWQEEKQSLLATNASNTAMIAGNQAVLTRIENGTNQPDYECTFDTSLAFYFYTNAKSINADIFMVDLKGNTEICSEIADSQTPICRHSVKTVPQSAINAVLSSKSGDYRTTGTLGDMYPDANYIVGVPVTVTDSTGNNIIVAVVFAVTSADMVSAFANDIIKVLIITIIIAFIIDLAVIYFMTYRLIHPLRQISTAAKAFGDGDFSIRVPVTSSDETGLLAISFNNMATSIAASENMYRSFVANVSHELKTPMTTIAGFIDGILDGTIPPEMQEKYLKIVSEEIRRLSRIIHSMLVLSKIDSGEIPLRPVRFELTGTIVNSLLVFEQQIEKKDLSILGMENMESVYVNGDPDLIHQVVYNLLENAVKFTNEGGYIEVSIRREDHKEYVKIKNSGSGIAKEELIHIFERFYKTDKSRSQDKSGVGLGLYIVKTIIQLHGGNITVDSVEGEYTEFEFYLPDSSK